jgi:Copper chaperone
MKKVIQINGMSCSHCTHSVEQALLSIDGITTAEADLKKKCAVVALSKEIPDEILINAIDDEGYEVVGIVTE